jgi:hypothetical protein
MSTSSIHGLKSLLEEGRNHANKILQKKLPQMTQTKLNKQILEMMQTEKKKKNKQIL